MTKKFKIISIFFITILICISNSCKEKQKVEKQKIVIYKEAKKIDYFNKARDSADKIIVKFYKLDEPNVLQNLKNVVWTKTIKSKKRILKLDSMIDSTKNDGYCCCPKTNYTISFYKNGVELITYNIDNISNNDEVLFFDNQYQTSYYLKLKKWNNFLTEK